MKGHKVHKSVLQFNKHLSSSQFLCQELKEHSLCSQGMGSIEL